MPHIDLERDWVAHGLRCVVNLHVCHDKEWRCGYVAVPVGHWAYGGHSDDFDVHGGITFGAEAGKYPVDAKDCYWYGFDFNHYQDSNTPLDVVCRECEQLAKQLSEGSPDAARQDAAV